MHEENCFWILILTRYKWDGEQINSYSNIHTKHIPSDNYCRLTGSLESDFSSTALKTSGGPFTIDLTFVFSQ